MPLLCCDTDSEATGSATADWRAIEGTHGKAPPRGVADQSRQHAGRNRHRPTPAPAPAWLRRLLRLPYLQASARELIHGGRSAQPQSAASSPVVYVHQREIAIVSPHSRASVNPPSPASVATRSSASTAPLRQIASAGSADATTCVIVILVCERTQRTIVTHLDGASRQQIQTKATDHAAAVPSSEALPPCTSLHAALLRFTAEDISEGVDVHLAGGFQTHAEADREAYGEEQEQQQEIKSSCGSSSLGASAVVHPDEESDLEENHEANERDGLLQVKDILMFLHRYSSGREKVAGSRSFQMRLKTLCVGPLNTQWAAENIANNSSIATAAAAAEAVPAASSSAPLPLAYPRPYVTSLFYQFSTRSVIASPPGFHRASRGPSMTLRFIRTSFGSGEELEQAYVEEEDCFCVQLTKYPVLRSNAFAALLSLPDPEFLQRCSTSPTCEPESFLPDMREMYAFLMKYPKWQAACKAEGYTQQEEATGKKWMRKSETNEWIQA